MLKSSPKFNVLVHLVLLLAIALLFFPLYIAGVIATHGPETLAAADFAFLPNTYFFENFLQTLSWKVQVPFALHTSSFSLGEALGLSVGAALIISLGKIILSLPTVLAMMYFRFKGRMLCLIIIFISLMMPVEFRIGAMNDVIMKGLFLNDLTGFSLSLLFSITSTFLIYQFFLTIPKELLMTARLDGAGLWRFFWDVMLPLIRTKLGALFAIEFIFVWNQYFWPLHLSQSLNTHPMIAGLVSMVGEEFSPSFWPVIMTGVWLSLLPSTLVFLLIQKNLLPILVNIYRPSSLPLSQ